MLSKHLGCSALLIALLAHVGDAQSASTNRGARILSLGIMALRDYEGDGGGVAAEWPVARLSPRFTLGVGGMIGLQHNAEPVGSRRLTTYMLPVLGVSNLQYQRRPDSRLAMYGGLSTGVTHVKVHDYIGKSPDERGTHFALGMQIGVRYRLANRVGLAT